MTADDDFILLGAYRDGESSAGEALALERRLAAEAGFQAVDARMAALSARLRTTLATPSAPPDLHARMARHYGPVPARPRRFGQAWQSLAAVFLLGLLGGGALGSAAALLRPVPAAEATADAVLAGHLRGLAAPQPFDIASSNRHVVKPWFNGRTTLAPDAPDLADQGFPLAGGRIDVVGGRSVPTLVYGHDRHVISVTVVPRTGGTGEVRRDGSTIERWDAGDLTYWVVSDLNAKDLRLFADLFRARTAPAG